MLGGLLMELKENKMESKSILPLLLSMSIPAILSMIIQSMYNIIDSMFVAQLGNDALTAVSLAFPIQNILLGAAVGTGIGVNSLISRTLGEKNIDKSNTVVTYGLILGFITWVAFLILGILFIKPFFSMYTDSANILNLATEYTNIVVYFSFGIIIHIIIEKILQGIGSMIYPMVFVLVGAIINIILDPVFIFSLDMGVRGAALATVISQMVSAIWVLRFLFGKKVLIPIQMKHIRIQKEITKDIFKLGTSNFIMAGTNCLVQVVCNFTLQSYGGDIYVGIMTVANSVREIFNLPISGIISGSQPVISFHYGAKEYKSVKSGIKFNTYVGATYTMFAWLFVVLFPQFWFGMFSNDMQMMDSGVEMLKLYFFGFVFMAFQFAGQSTFQALGDAKHAIFFSLLRKAIIVVPLTIVLPMLGFGVAGVFMAEPISNVIGGLASYITMRMTVYKKLDVR